MAVHITWMEFYIIEIHQRKFAGLEVWKAARSVMHYTGGRRFQVIGPCQLSLVGWKRSCCLQERVFIKFTGGNDFILEPPLAC